MIEVIKVVIVSFHDRTFSVLHVHGPQNIGVRGHSDTVLAQIKPIAGADQLPEPQHALGQVPLEAGGGHGGLAVQGHEAAVAGGRDAASGQDLVLAGAQEPGEAAGGGQEDGGPQEVGGQEQRLEVGHDLVQPTRGLNKCEHGLEVHVKRLLTQLL